MPTHEDAFRNAAKALKKPFKKLVFHIKQGLSSGMSASGEWLIYNAQRFSPYKFRAYQPMPWIGLKTRKRDESTQQRWQAIEKNLGTVGGTALDIGSNPGYFVLRLAEKGFYGIGIDMAYGHEQALDMLRVIWGKTRHAMFFEAGEDSEIRLLNITGIPADWVRTQLERACPDATIRVIGTFDRGAHQEIRQARTLFAVYR